MLERLKFWQNKTPTIKVEDLSPGQVTELIARGVIKLGQEPLGDGKGEFLGEGTEQEFEAQQKADKGLKGVFGI